MSKFYQNYNIAFVCMLFSWFHIFKASYLALFRCSIFKAIEKRLDLNRWWSKGSFERSINGTFCSDGETGQYNSRVPGAAVRQRGESQHVPQPAPLLASDHPATSRAAPLAPPARSPPLHHVKHILLRALMHELLKWIP